MRIGRIQPRVKPDQSHRQGDPYYQTTEWKYKRELVWKRDQSLCQMCKQKGIIHPLTKGTKDINKQGTVDHKKPREAGGSDELDNLWLIGTNHHAAKSVRDKKYYK